MVGSALVTGGTGTADTYLLSSSNFWRKEVPHQTIHSSNDLQPFLIEPRRSLASQKSSRQNPGRQSGYNRVDRFLEDIPTAMWVMEERLSPRGPQLAYPLLRVTFSGKSWAQLLTLLKLLCSYRKEAGPQHSP